MKAKLTKVGAFLLLLVPLTLLAPAITPRIVAASLVTWAKTYGDMDNDRAFSVVPASDGGFIISGISSNISSASVFSSWVRKLDSDGNIVWSKTFYDTRLNTRNAVAPTSDGGYAVFGETRRGLGRRRVLWVAKLNSSGGIEWQEYFRRTSEDGASAVMPTADGGTILAGGTRSSSTGTAAAWVLKLNGNGNISWQKTFRGSVSVSANSILPTNDGGYLVGGGITRPEMGNDDVWLLKLDANGNIVWQKSYGGSHIESAESILATSDGGFLVGGSTTSFGAGERDAWVFKLESTGNVLWQKTLGGSAGDSASSLLQASDGGYLVAGSTSSFGAGSDDVWLFKLDAEGNIAWEKTFGGLDADTASSLSPSKHSGYAIAGFTSSFGAGGADAWVLKLDANGNIGGGCNLIGSSAAIVANSGATVETTTAEAVDTTVSPIGTGSTLLNPSVQVATQCEGTASLQVEIDVKPGSDENPINLKSRGLLPVGILSTSTFDASTVDASSVKFGPSGATSTQNGQEDVNDDGLIDLVLHFRTQETGIQSTDTQVCLTGEVVTGTAIEGCDSVRIR